MLEGLATGTPGGCPLGGRRCRLAAGGRRPCDDSAGLDSPAGYALKTGEPVVSQHVERESRFRFPALLVEHGVTRAINVIIRGETGPFGVLEVDSSHDGEFSEHDVAFLQTAANVLAAAIVRQRAEAVIREDRERIRLALEAGSLGAWQIELPSWRMTSTDLCKATFGRTRDDPPLSYAMLIATIHPDDRGRLRAAIEHALASGADYDTECRIVRPDGVVRVIHCRGRALLGADGSPIRLLGVTLDITERTAAAVELMHYREHLEELVVARTRELAASEAERRPRPESAVPGAEDGGGRADDRRTGARLQQPPHGDRRQSRPDEGGHAARDRVRTHDRVGAARRRARRSADPSAAGLRPPPSPQAGGDRRQPSDHRDREPDPARRRRVGDGSAPVRPTLGAVRARYRAA
ncbi:MAG: PAS domain-containing protein [Pseudomonadota bacterium]